MKRDKVLYKIFASDFKDSHFFITCKCGGFARQDSTNSEIIKCSNCAEKISLKDLVGSLQLW